MIAIAISVLFAGALFTGLTPRWSPGARALAVPQISIAFVGLYLAVSDQVAQDRAEYYRWYRTSAALLVDPDARDRGFTLLLNALPAGLSPDAFGFVLSAMMVSLICGFLITLARRNLIHWVGVPIALVFAVCDRLFLDITLNSSRSSLAALVFLFGAIQRKSGWRWALWAVGFGLHGRIVLILSALWWIAIFFENRPALLKTVLALAVGAMMFRLLTGSPLLPAAAALDFFLNVSESETVSRGIGTASELTPSLAVQLLLGVVATTAFVWWAGMIAPPARAMTDLKITRSVADDRHRLLVLSLVVAAAGLMLYPDLSLAQRVFLVPILCLPGLMPGKAITLLAAAKLAVLAALLPGSLA